MAGFATIPGRHWVYVLSDEHGRVKIGEAKSFNSRFNQYKTHNPDRLTARLVQTCSSRAIAKRVELYALNALSHNLKHGEWFDDTCDNAVMAVRSGMKKCGQKEYACRAGSGGFAFHGYFWDVPKEVLKDEVKDLLGDLGGRKPVELEQVKTVFRKHIFYRKIRGEYRLTVNYDISSSYWDEEKGRFRPRSFSDVERKTDEKYTIEEAFNFIDMIYAPFPINERWFNHPAN